MKPLSSTWSTAICKRYLQYRPPLPLCLSHSNMPRPRPPSLVQQAGHVEAALVADTGRMFQYIAARLSLGFKNLSGTPARLRRAQYALLRYSDVQLQPTNNVHVCDYDDQSNVLRVQHVRCSVLLQVLVPHAPRHSQRAAGPKVLAHSPRWWWWQQCGPASAA